MSFNHKANSGFSTTQAPRGSGTEASVAVVSRPSAREMAASSEAIEVRASQIEELDGGRQGSDDSSAPLITGMIDASLGDNGRVGYSEVRIS
jgi:hypothetical protein